MNQSIQTITFAKLQEAYLKERQNPTTTRPDTISLSESAYVSIMHRFAGLGYFSGGKPFRQSTASKAYALVEGVNL